jgi:hypothetical protein
LPLSYLAYCTQNSLFHPNPGCGSHERPCLLSTQYTNFARWHGPGIKLRGAQRIVHPRTTMPGPSLDIPSHPRRPVDGPPFQTRQQGVPHVTPHQITPYNHLLHDSAMISSQISCDGMPQRSQSQYGGAYPTLPGQCDPQVNQRLRFILTKIAYCSHADRPRTGARLQETTMRHLLALQR